MQRAVSWLPSWDRTKTTSKKGFDKTWAWADKLGAPVNRLTNKIGSEAFWPTSLDKECDKAARILKTFCKDGFYTEEDRPSTQDGPNAKSKQRVLKKIPQKVIENAVGLAIFTTMRTGLWISGAGGSGILIARKEDGTWSPPSGILLHTAGLGFLVGVDIYDCVVVINNRKTLESFTKIRATLGGEISAVAGPLGIGGVLENDGNWKQANKPVFTYLKSRGFYAGVQVDGTVIIERTDENERFYGQRIGVADILAGNVRHTPFETKLLMETVKAAEGRDDVDTTMLEQLKDEPAPGDVDLQAPTSMIPIFGIPEPDDPDPFGVLALENAGLEIREAGTKARPVSSQFEYNPAPSSPIYTRYNRRSFDTQGGRSNRESYMSWKTRASTDRGTQTTEMGTQTDDSLSIRSPRTISPSTSPSYSEDDKKIIEEDEKSVVLEPEEVDYTKIDLGPYQNLNHSQDFDGTTINGSPPNTDGRRQNSFNSMDDLSDDEDFEEEEAVVFEAASAQATVITPQVIKARGGVVNIPKRGPPPPLPPRNSLRNSKLSTASPSSDRSPSREGFEAVDVHGVESSNIKRTSLEQASMTPLPFSPNRKSFEQFEASMVPLPFSPNRKSFEQTPIVMEDVETEESESHEPVVEEQHEKVESAKEDSSFNEKVEILDEEHPTQRPALTKENTESFHSIAVNIPGGWN
ncbi:c5eb49d3-f65c-44de-b8d7-8d07f3d68fd5 [Sclerotinia trifoliorum]|uniref:C5eb49d3-f65c-44de-b8d7-8d07f3d68fd5 n=1 Tax=Sclerotinia trifoliorum TaxID=28548 RepID=A0A8H2VW73_9HELO|nr:c5eb49d3-f65c-44de-b8d7-8d07f3d68fd5 [Sclerotinia trifoliorum]